ncbi:unnamed protein product, partial [Musa hybrid cultivar]
MPPIPTVASTTTFLLGSCFVSCSTSASASSSSRSPTMSDSITGEVMRLTRGTTLGSAADTWSCNLDLRAEISSSRSLRSLILTPTACLNLTSRKQAQMGNPHKVDGFGSDSRGVHFWASIRHSSRRSSASYMKSLRSISQSLTPSFSIRCFSASRRTEWMLRRERRSFWISPGTPNSKSNFSLAMSFNVPSSPEMKASRTTAIFDQSGSR